MTVRASIAALGIALFVLVHPVMAGPLEDAAAAYKRGDYAKAVELYRRLAKQGDANAQNKLGLMYHEGRGASRNDAEAVKWYRKAAEQGHAGAQYNLGLMYHDGRGVAQNFAEAVKWYRKAAEQGHAKAKFTLGLMYEQGDGVHQNFVQAYMWFSLSAAAPDWEQAAAGRKRVSKSMTPGQIAEARRLIREWLAAHPPK